MKPAIKLVQRIVNRNLPWILKFLTVDSSVLPIFICKDTVT